MTYNREKELYEIIFFKTVFTENIDLMNRMHNYIYDLVNNSTGNDDNINNLTMFYFQMALFLFKTIIPSIPTDTTTVVKLSKITSVINYKFSTLVLKNVLLISEENNANNNMLRQLSAQIQSIGTGTGTINKQVIVIDEHGCSVSQEGGEGNQEGGEGNQEGGVGNQEGGVGNQEGGEDNQQGGVGNQEGGVGNQEGVVGNQQGDVGNQQGGEGGVDNQEEGEGNSDNLKNEFLIFRKNSNISLGNSNDSSLDNKYIELDASENQILNISDINNSNLEVIKNKKGGNKKKVAIIKSSRKMSIEPSYNKDSILNNSKIYKLTKL
jgi:hypothetical protein